MPKAIKTTSVLPNSSWTESHDILDSRVYGSIAIMLSSITMYFIPIPIIRVNKTGKNIAVFGFFRTFSIIQDLIVLVLPNVVNDQIALFYKQRP